MSKTNERKIKTADEQKKLVEFYRRELGGDDAAAQSVAWTSAAWSEDTRADSLPLIPSNFLVALCEHLYDVIDDIESELERRGVDIYAEDAAAVATNEESDADDWATVIDSEA